MWHNKCVLACLLNISVGIMLLGRENGLFSASFIFNIALMGKLLAVTIALSLKEKRQKCHQESSKDIGKQLVKKDRAEGQSGASIFYFRDNENI